jgi:hypothetical protein
MRPAHTPVCGTGIEPRTTSRGLQSTPPDRPAATREKDGAREDQQQQQAQRRAALAHSIDGTRSEGVEDITF